MRIYYKKGGAVRKRKRKDTGMKGMSIKSGDKCPTKSGAGMTQKEKERLGVSLIALVPQGR